MSKGLRDLRLMTSASIPCPDSSFAASKLNSTALECATNVMCLPEIQNTLGIVMKIERGKFYWARKTNSKLKISHFHHGKSNI